MKTGNRQLMTDGLQLTTGGAIGYQGVDGLDLRDESEGHRA
jgi:hypothetical protein